MRPVKHVISRHPSRSTLVFVTLLLSALPILAGCEGGGTTNQVLLDHSGRNPDSIYRHHNN